MIRENLDCFCIEYSGKGPSGVWMLTAKPLKQGIVSRLSGGVQRRGNVSLEDGAGAVTAHVARSYRSQPEQMQESRISSLHSAWRRGGTSIGNRLQLSREHAN